MVGAVLIATDHVLRATISNRNASYIFFIMVLLTSAAISGLAQHVRSMLSRFDHGHHLRLNLALGALHALLWVLWWRAARGGRPHAWRGPAIIALLAAAAIFELTDAPPLWGAIDGHAMWHAATIPLAHIWWRCFVGVELQWRHDIELHRASTKSL